jgi:choline transporter-like protein 2/4/5
MTAIYGQGFCKASRDSFSLLMRNLVRVVVLNRVTGFLLFVGKALIVVGNGWFYSMITCKHLTSGAIAFYYFSGKWVVDGIPQVNLHYYFVPIIVSVELKNRAIKSI